MMNIVILQWGLFSFMVGLVLSLPLAAVHYQKNPLLRKTFTNPKKLKSAHIDYFMQALSAGLVYLIGMCMDMDFPKYIAIPLIYGIIMNPTILLLEATPFIRSGWSRFTYLFLRATSPLLLLFGWVAIAVLFLPLYLIILLVAVIIVGGAVLWSQQVQKKNTVDM
jgi:hypothetical protein